MNNVFIAIALTMIAGLSTCIGGLIAIFSKGNNKNFLGFSLGISAGVMIYVSFMELLVKSMDVFCEYHSPKVGTTFVVIWFFSGMLLGALIDRIIPDAELVPKNVDKSGSKLMRTGLVTALAMGIHNFPEGMATFVSALSSPALAIPIVAAIAIHNIPEGIAVSVPILYATKSRGKAFFYAFLSGIAEPVGAVIGYLVLMPFINDVTNAAVFAAVAGIMVYISVDELLPAARRFSKGHTSVYGVVIGMIIMAISLIGFM